MPPWHAACRALMTPEPSHPMNFRTLIRPRTRTTAPGSRRRPPAGSRRPALLLGVAAAGALVVNVAGAGEPAAQAESQLESVSIADQLGIPAGGPSADASTVIDEETVRPLEQLAASRADRDAE
jgi:hypothetical protein